MERGALRLRRAVLLTEARTGRDANGLKATEL
jgi:hypothetical protein